MRLRSEALRWLAFRPRRAARDAKPTFFLHIPKCAGTSVWASLFDIYGSRYVYVVNTKSRKRRFVGMDPSARGFYSAVGGHAPLSYFREHLGALSAYHKIVTLRDPIDRAISQYGFVRSQPSHPRYEELAPLSLDEFASSKSLRPDRQVTVLTGRSDDVDRAVDIVTNYFDDWALSDDIDRLVRRLYEVTGVTPRNAEHKNKGVSGPRRADLSSSALRIMEDRNRHDLALIAALRKLRGS